MFELWGITDERSWFFKFLHALPETKKCQSHCQTIGGCSIPSEPIHGAPSPTLGCASADWIFRVWNSSTRVNPQNVRFQNVWFQNVRFQNFRFTKRQVSKHLVSKIQFLYLIYLLNKKYRKCQVCIAISKECVIITYYGDIWQKKPLK